MDGLLYGYFTSKDDHPAPAAIWYPRRHREPRFLYTGGNRSRKKNIAPENKEECFTEIVGVCFTEGCT